MTGLLGFLSLFSLIIAHPLEQLSSLDYCSPEYPIQVFRESGYAAPDNGFVKDVIEYDGLFQITLSLDDGSEIVYCGLTDVKKEEGDRIAIGELLGQDKTISHNTKFVLVFYEESKLFPQFEENNLPFLTNAGTKLYSVADGTVLCCAYLSDNFEASVIYTEIEDGKVIPQSNIPIEAGYFCQIKLHERNTYISYWHLMALAARSADILQQGDPVAYSGNTGASTSPRLVLHFEDMELGSDIRAVYYRGVKTVQKDSK